MPVHVENTPIAIRCLAEKWAKRCKFLRLIHDGSKGTPDGRYFFTRVYAIFWRGKQTNVGIKFTYDYRVGVADVTIDDVPLKLMDKVQNAEDVTEEMVAAAMAERYPHLSRLETKEKDMDGNEIKDVDFNP